jgi:hypothetical protein
VKFWAKLLIMGALLLGLPLLSADAVDATWAEMFELPPKTEYGPEASFHWAAFLGFCAFTLAWVVPFVVHAIRAPDPRRRAKRERGRFPWWGWAAMVVNVGWWVLAWNRFAWFAPLQRFTFLPLWLTYVLVVNGLTMRRTGRCLMLRRPRFFLLLFPLSAGFWWFFEYLNRFVQNWRYEEVQMFSPAEYICGATLAFSTVLPAVLSTRELLLTFPVFNKFRSFASVRTSRPRVVAVAVLVASGVGLACIGRFPRVLFPLLWISPLLIAVSIQALFGDRHVFSGLPEGNWRPVISAALAALVCGVFWETWNIYSLAKWVYNVPLVSRFKVFEMPLIGYAGYLPFGLECAVLGELLTEALGRRSA